MIFLLSFIKLDPGISEKCVGQTFDRRKKERKKERKKKNNKKWSKHSMSSKLRLGDIIRERDAVPLLSMATVIPNSY
jgi:hypothetical protein